MKYYFFIHNSSYRFIQGSLVVLNSLIQNKVSSYQIQGFHHTCITSVCIRERGAGIFIKEIGKYPKRWFSICSFSSTGRCLVLHPPYLFSHRFLSLFQFRDHKCRGKKIEKKNSIYTIYACTKKKKIQNTCQVLLLLRQ